MNKGVKIRLYPNQEQSVFMNKTFGCCRLIYNKGLNLRETSYKDGKSIGYKETSSMLTELKNEEEYSFLKEVDSISLQQALRDLDIAYKNFFKHLSRYPAYKSKHDHNQSYRTINQGGSIRIEDSRIKLPKLGFVKFKANKKRKISFEHINHVTVEMTASGKYYAVMNVDFTPEVQTNKTGAVGIDVGIAELYTDSNGHIVHNPKYLEKSEKKLRREQRRLSRKQIGSNNFNMQRKIVARVHEKVENQRNDFLHKQSTILVSENQTICIEDLNIKGMIQNGKLAKSIASVSWGKFFNMIEYKAMWYGSTVQRVPTTYPSSQTCSCCNYKNPIVKNLSIRKWVCPNCGAEHDRDVNASKNILKKGLAS